MYIQTIKNMLIFFGMLTFWLVLITIEVLTGYSGLFLQVIYGLSMFALFVGFWMVNRTTVQNIRNEFFQFMASGAIALVLMAVYLMTVWVAGAGYKNLLDRWVH